ncbi:unnamed protein product, partial [Closterium sp. Naga37s-1]
QALLVLDGEWGLWKHNLSSVMCDEWVTEDAIAHCNPQGMVTSLYLMGTTLNGSHLCNIRRFTALTTLVIGKPPWDSQWIGADYDVPTGDYDYSSDPYVEPNPTDSIPVNQSTMGPPVMQGSMDDLSCLAPLTRLQTLSLTNLNLTAGELPSSLSALTSLRHLDLSFLRITRLPQWISSLSRLAYLDVTGSFDVHLIAPFPTEWMALTGLAALRVGLNGFTGSIPSTISALTALSNLDLHYNSLLGSIPAGISNLTSLQYLQLSHNNLAGAVPALDLAHFVDLSHNHLTTMPPNIGSSEINLSHNDLKGSVPAYGFYQLNNIDLSYNPLNEISDALFLDYSVAVVDSLNFGSCNFSGPFPWLPALRFINIDVSNNSFTGPFPDVLLNVDAFSYLTNINLSHNNFTGSLSPMIYEMTLLETLNISHNRFSGAVPSDAWALSSLKSLSMAHNQLEGPLPNQMGFVKLTVLELQGNAFSGPLPDLAHWKFTSLLVLDVSDNQLNGSLPDSISRFVTLQHLGIGGNKLSGPIPAGLGRLIELTSLNISGTRLTCPADGSKCVVQQASNSSFCRLCSSFCSSCTPRL